MKTKQFKLTVLSLLIAVSTSFAGGLKIDKEASSIKWVGKKISGEHYGAIIFQDGEFDMQNGKLAGGTFTVNMNSITCDDLTGEWNQKLVGHLKSDDFFGVEKYPVSKLEITEVKPVSGHMYKFSGTLTIKGKSLPISFESHVHASNSHVEASGKLVIDRTEYDIRYGSGKFFDNLGDRMIHDDFTLEYQLVAKK